MNMSYAIRLLKESDLPEADGLRAAAGWNQLTSDWQRILRYESQGCFVAESQGQIVGTVTTTPYDYTLAWIGMMLVHPDFRRQGIASALMRQALKFLQHQNVSCIKLDATPAGRPVYERLGFQSEWVFHRWHRFFNAGTANKTDLRPVSFSDDVSDDLRTLDTQAFGADRMRWLQLLSADSTIIACSDAFGMLRAGQMASYLGPVTAASSTSAADVIDRLLMHRSGDVFWDIPAPNEPATRIARSLGFRPVRDLTRMWLGTRTVTPEYQWQFALTDPGTG